MGAAINAFKPLFYCLVIEITGLWVVDNLEELKLVKQDRLALVEKVVDEEEDCLFDLIESDPRAQIALDDKSQTLNIVKHGEHHTSVLNPFDFEATNVGLLNL